MKVNLLPETAVHSPPAAQWLPLGAHGDVLSRSAHQQSTYGLRVSQVFGSRASSKLLCPLFIHED